ncbi:sugar nucleotide-binding protein [Bacillus lacus]|uniref:dTDP-4-dehydrorhamnose reductase n=1 Tax=Metabacillus lacus TaxID=1983721 RepID=A0A7X2IYT7_9BACI|nr:SDR family oxidoreductase [Metabacillus lacus]MRX72302.1 sugar nucleotide-binding protein [Metabacillus lacus]
MKLLILGGKGMAGHIAAAYFGKLSEYQVFYTSRDPQDQNGIFLEVTDVNSLEKIIDIIKPHIIINCIGILNDHAAKDPMLALQVNSLLPHQLVKLADRQGARVVHISTDCVFLGTKGSYTENDLPDGISEYARSKRWGEFISDKHLTVRTSIIGPELKTNGIGLFQWFMKQSGEIKGFKRALWNGVTTLELAKAIHYFIENNVTGLYHLGMEDKISKYDLLHLIGQVFGKGDVQIEPDEDFVLDRTIKNTRTDFVYRLPSYQVMLEELRDWMKQQ